MSEKKCMKRIKLNENASIPVFGLGTWKSSEGEVHKAVLTALDAGYRHIDTAWVYGNQKEVGQAVADWLKADPKKNKREDIFIVSKIWCNFHSRVREGAEDILKQMGLDYLDMLLIHWPTAFKSGSDPFPKDENGLYLEDTNATHQKTWKQMEALQKEGICRAIGLSNFNEQQIKDILANCEIPPAVLQIEHHPYLTQEQLVNFCSQNKILVTAYSPLGSPDRPSAKSTDPVLLEDPVVAKIAKKHNVSPGQVLLRFPIEQGLAVIAKSANEKRIVSNLDCLSFSLDKEDMNELLELGKRNFRYIWLEPKNLPTYPF